MTNISFHPTISIPNQEKTVKRVYKIITKRICFDLLTNSLNQFLKEMYEDQSREFVFGHLDLRWLNTVLQAVSSNSHDGACFKLDKQTWRRKKQWYTDDDFSKSTH